MAVNAGKKFENNWKASLPDDVLYYRLPDPPQSFNQTNHLRFSWRNPCDIFILNPRTRTFYALELKSTKATSLSFERERKSYKAANIKYHQIEALTDFAKFDCVVSGFIFNFRIEKEDTERTYFQNIDDFNVMISEIDKKSFNEKDLLKYNPVLIEQRRLKVNYRYNVGKFLQSVYK